MSIASHPRLPELLAMLGDTATPIYVRVNERKGAVPLECFTNCEREVSRYGGKVVFGWWIQAVEGIILEAQFHAVVETPNGTLFDPTPSGTSMRRLFVCDFSRVFDGVDIPNIKIRLTTDPIINRLMDINDFLDGSIAALPKQFEIREFERIADELAVELKLTPREAAEQVAVYRTDRFKIIERA